MDNSEIMRFIYWEQSSRDTIDFKKSYVDLADDLVAGLLLSQIVYWHLPSKETGKTKLRVKKDGHLWIAKGREDWWEEIRITGKQFDRASNILAKKGLIEKKRFKFNSNPTVHVRLIWENFLPRLEDIILNANEEESEGKFEEDTEETGVEPLGDMVFPQRVKSNFPKGKKRNSPKGKMEIDQRGKSLTESTAEIKTENNTEINPKKDVSIVNKDELKNICNNYFSELSVGRWSKKEWFTLIDKFVQELIDSKKLDSIHDIESYIKVSLENIAYKHDLKYGKLDTYNIAKQEESNRDTSIYYNWLLEDD
jgi:hypothetical protein